MLLRGHFALQMMYWVSQGRPALPIKEFYSSVTKTPTPPKSDPAKKTDASATLPIINPWLTMVQHCLPHQDEHLIKGVRTLSHYDVLYGSRTPGSAPFLRSSSSVKLDGEELLDGTLFIRVAGCAMESLGWHSHPEGNLSIEKGYDKGGPGWDEWWTGKEYRRKREHSL